MTTEIRYIDGDTIHLSVIAEVVWQNENAVCVAVPDVDEPFIVPLRTDDGGELRAVVLDPALTDVRPGDVYQARLTGFLWIAVNLAADALVEREVRFVSAQDGRVVDPATVLREYGPLRRVVAVDQADDRPVMFHLPTPDLPAAPEHVTVQHAEDLADPLPATVPIDPAATPAPLPDDVVGYPVSPAPMLPPLLPSASTAPGEVDDPTAVSTLYRAVVHDADQTVLTVRTDGLDGVMPYVLPAQPDATQMDRAEVWAATLATAGWERVGGWRRTSVDDGYFAPVRPAKRPEPTATPDVAPTQPGEVSA